jgi:type I restriction enzyme S subunit
VNRFPQASLGDFLTHRAEFITIEDDLEYKRARVQLYGRGIVLRDSVPGAEIRTKKQQVAMEGEFLVAEIDAKVGGFGIVPPELNDALVSSHYFLFRIDEGKCLKGWLDAYIKSGGLQEQVSARGSTNYAAIRPAQVLQLQIPLPPLDEQRRIVAKIHELLGRVTEISRLIECLGIQYDSLLRSLLGKESEHQGPIAMRELVRRRDPDVVVQPDEEYHFAGVYCFGRGLFRGQRKLGSEFAYPKLTRLRKGDFTYPKLMAWEGAFGIVPHQCDGLVVSTEFPVFEIRQDRVLPETLDVYFRNPSVWPMVAGASTGTNVRRRRLNPEDFLSLEIPIPSMGAQLSLRSVYSRLEKIWEIDGARRSRVEALAPALLNRAFAGEL